MLVFGSMVELKNPITSKKTPLAVDWTQTQVFADSMAFAARALIYGGL